MPPSPRSVVDSCSSRIAKTAFALLPRTAAVTRLALTFTGFAHARAATSALGEGSDNSTALHSWLALSKKPAAVTTELAAAAVPSPTTTATAACTNSVEAMSSKRVPAMWRPEDAGLSAEVFYALPPDMRAEVEAASAAYAQTHRISKKRRRTIDAFFRDARQELGQGKSTPTRR